MFKKVLIANRGEIAVRVTRTLRALGIPSVAVHSDPDKDAPHVLEADYAVHIGPARATKSYLNIERIVEVARETGADAIHPGYGFLAENPLFAQSCVDAGITFIGPTAESMKAVGDKAAARTVANAASVPVVPGGDTAFVEPADAAKAARELELPVLIKASAGGGGKGMRRVDHWDDLEDAIAGAQREALSAFGDSRVLVEQYIHPVRHVEVQVFGDGKGGVVAIGERECSLQRRHQKIVEESPSVAVDTNIRQAMLEAGRTLAAEVNYSGAGTVEFLLDSKGQFFFLEMNTRLQVEHPVTECVYGLDLVRLQLEVAASRTLSLSQNRIAPRGHAIEARVYAEDPANGFLPTAGELLLVHWPDLPGLRVDSGIRAGQQIGVHYDPMIAKLIAFGSDREEARRRLIDGLKQTAILGLVTNQSFLIDLLDSKGFRTGETFTDTVERWAKDWSAPALSGLELLGAAHLLIGQKKTRIHSGGGPSDADPFNPWNRLGHWRADE